MRSPPGAGVWGGCPTPFYPGHPGGAPKGGPPRETSRGNCPEGLPEGGARGVYAPKQIPPRGARPSFAASPPGPFPSTFPPL